MVHALVSLLDLLTNCQVVEALARDVFTIGLANTAFACLLGSAGIIRSFKLRRDTPAQLRA
jgi:hypothetical protein